MTTNTTGANTAVKLKEGFNKAFIVGTLVEKNLESKPYTDNQTGATVERIMGTISVRTGENEVHQIRLRQNKMKKAGGENTLYKALETINNEYVSVADTESNPELVPTQLSVQGSIVNNEYYGQDGQLRQYQQIQGLFVNRLREQDDPTPRATFEVEIFVKNVIPEMEGEDETGRAIVNAIIPTYQAATPYKFATVKEGTDFFLNDVESNSTLKVYGQIVNKREKHVKQVPSGFGEPIEEVTFSFTTESLIMNASLPYEEENVSRFKPELIKEALVTREVRLEQGRERANTSSQPSGAGMNAFGGGAVSTTPTISEAEAAGVDLSGLF